MLLKVATIGSRLKYIREFLKMKQYELSEDLEIPPSTLSAMENDKRSIPLHVVIKLFTIHRVNSNWLLHGEGPEFIEQHTPPEQVNEPDATYNSNKLINTSELEAEIVNLKSDLNELKKMIGEQFSD